MITATLVNYYLLCHRKLWLHAHEVRMEHTSDRVYSGKLLHETAYPRRSGRFREVVLPGGKIDFYDPVDRVAHEIKHSPKMEAAHIAQVKFYLWLLEEQGIQGAHGLLEYPQQRKTQEVWLSEADRKEIPTWIAAIEKLLREPCPEKLPKPKCRGCSYFEFCWVEEIETG